MPTLDLELRLKIDGKELYQSPMRFRFSRDEFQQFDYDEADDGNDTSFSAIPVNQITTVQDILIQAIDQAVGVRVEGGEATNVAIRLSAGGFVFIVNGSITGTNITINNNSGNTAKIRGYGAGT